jgi:hypothetical protein
MQPRSNQQLLQQRRLRPQARGGVQQQRGFFILWSLLTSAGRFTPTSPASIRPTTLWIYWSMLERLFAIRRLKKARKILMRAGLESKSRSIKQL